MSQVVSSALEQEYRDAFPESAKHFQQGRETFPSGVTHDARYLEPFPVYVQSAAGSRKQTVEGRELIDYWMGHGSMLLGHSHPAVVAAVQKQAALGTHYGACHESEMRWAEWVIKLIPSAERVRFVNSGTEATLMALRVSRIVSGKTKVIKFAGHFHGWHDGLIPGADAPHDTGSYAMPGVTDSVMGDLVIVPPNNLAALEQAIDEHDPACVFVEATGGHFGAVPVRGEFLRGLRELTERKGVILVCDEVITGFRVHPSGAQGYYEFVPDLTTMAKILAGGLPGGALAGRADLMAALEFDNPHGKKMKHPGTFNGNPLSAAAGIAALEIVSTGEPCTHANEVARRLRTEINEVFARKNAPWVAYGEFSAVNILPNYTGPRPESDDFIPHDNRLEMLDISFDRKLTSAFRMALLLNGVDFFGWKAMTSAAHSDEDIQQTVTAFDHMIDRLRDEGLSE
jgi:glutamate-1-semialdehyde 2,1-aminomutase